MFGYDALGERFRIIEYLPDRKIDKPGSFLAVILVTGDFLSDKNGLIFMPIGYRAQFLCHTKLANHLPRDVGRGLEIGSRAGRGLAVHERLGDVPAVADANAVAKPTARSRVGIGLGERNSQAQRLTARDDRHFMERIGVLEIVVE